MSLIFSTATFAKDGQGFVDRRDVRKIWNNLAQAANLKQNVEIRVVDYRDLDLAWKPHYRTEMFPRVRKSKNGMVLVVPGGFLDAQGRSEDQVAAILAHEVIHLTHDHELHDGRKWDSGGPNLSQEREADREAIKLAHKAGYKVTGLENALKVYSEIVTSDVFYDSHQERAKTAERQRKALENQLLDDSLVKKNSKATAR